VARSRAEVAAWVVGRVQLPRGRLAAIRQGLPSSPTWPQAAGQPARDGYRFPVQTKFLVIAAVTRPDNMSGYRRTALTTSQFKTSRVSRGVSTRAAWPRSGRCRSSRLRGPTFARVAFTGGSRFVLPRSPASRRGHGAWPRSGRCCPRRPTFARVALTGGSGGCAPASRRGQPLPPGRDPAGDPAGDVLPPRASPDSRSWVMHRLGEHTDDGGWENDLQSWSMPARAMSLL